MQSKNTNPLKKYEKSINRRTYTYCGILILMMSILTDWILQLLVFMVTVGKVEQRRKIQKECSKSSVILKFILSAILEMEQQNWILNLWFWLQRSRIRFWQKTDFPDELIMNYWPKKFLEYLGLQ